MIQDLSAYFSAYREPDPVLTTVPAFAPRWTGDVVILVPLRNALELLMMPVMEPSAFCVQRDNAGKLGSTRGFGAGLGFGGAGFGFAAAFGAGFTACVPPPKILKDGRGAGAGAGVGATFFATG